MKKWDYVFLKNELSELSKNGIHKGYSGLVTDVKDTICTVWFTNPKNDGELAWANINQDNLQYADIQLEDSLLNEIDAFISGVDLNKYTSLTDVAFSEYDKVALKTDKPQYQKAGVIKGAIGCVIQPYAIKNKICVEFYNLGPHKNESVEIMVNIDDLTLAE